MRVHCWGWGSKLVQPQWKTEWQFFKKLRRELPRDLAISFLSIYPRDLKEGSQRDICTPIVIAALVIKAKMWKQLSVHQWIIG